MTDLLKKENDDVIKNFLHRTFFSGWKPENIGKEKYLNYRSLEIQVSPACDLKCKYCYYAKYHKDLYPPKISKKSLVLKNLDMLLNWLKENEYYPYFDIFSGELFMQELGWKVLERVVEWQNNNEVKHRIMIPTNYSFIFDEEKIERLENIMKKSDKRIFLSASVDGNFSDIAQIKQDFGGIQVFFPDSLRSALSFQPEARAI